MCDRPTIIRAKVAQEIVPFKVVAIIANRLEFDDYSKLIPLTLFACAFSEKLWT